MFRRIRGRRSRFFFSSLRYTTFLPHTAFALSRRVNKSRIVRGIWSAFDAGRTRLVAARGRREKGERRLGREIRRKPRNDSPARKSRFHPSTRPISALPPGLCVFCLLLYHRIPKRPRFYMFSLSPPALNTLFRQSCSHF